MTAVACVKESDVFIPNATDGTQALIQSLIPDNSLVKELDMFNRHVIVAPDGTSIDLEADILLGGPDKYTLSFIGLDSYKDYIAHNVDLHSFEGPVDNIYAFYISLTSEEGSELRLDDGAYITVRVPSEELNASILAGIGSFESGRFSWNYTDHQLNSTLIYDQWIITENDGSYRTESGYTLKVRKSGWYNLAVKKNGDYSFAELCLSYTDERFDHNNTISFALSNDKSYLTALDNQGPSGYCSSSLPFDEEARYAIVSISEIDEEIYFGKSLVSKHDDVLYQELLPISKEQLVIELDKL